MFSLGKIFVLTLIILVIWFGFKYIERIRKDNNSKLETARRKDTIKDAGNMIKCPQCTAFVVASGATACGKSICPY